ncbi:MAG: NAD(P)-dependent oxidoreductase, partial [Cyclobacteriaceae bacterium]
IPSTAEHTWALLLALMRNLPSAVNSVKQGNWDRDQFKGNNLSGKRLGIIGLGRVGKQVAHFAKAFKCEVGSYDPYQNRWLGFVQQFSSLKELVRWAEIVTLHIPYSIETHHFIGKELLSSFNKGSILINTSRGGVWDESEVSALVKSGYLAGVATDVLEFELEDTKRPSSPLLKLMASNQNVLITPHIAGATFESMELTEIFIAQKLKTAINVS